MCLSLLIFMWYTHSAENRCKNVIIFNLCTTFINKDGTCTWPCLKDKGKKMNKTYFTKS